MMTDTMVANMVCVTRVIENDYLISVRPVMGSDLP